MNQFRTDTDESSNRRRQYAYTQPPTVLTAFAGLQHEIRTKQQSDESPAGPMRSGIERPGGLARCDLMTRDAIQRRGRSATNIKNEMHFALCFSPYSSFVQMTSRSIIAARVEYAPSASSRAACQAETFCRGTLIDLGELRWALTEVGKQYETYYHWCVLRSDFFCRSRAEASISGVAETEI